LLKMKVKIMTIVEQIITNYYTESYIYEALVYKYISFETYGYYY